MFDLSNLFNKDKSKAALSKNAVAELLKVNPEALDAFEKAYTAKILDSPKISDNLFEINAKQAAKLKKEPADLASVDVLVKRIVDELLGQTTAYHYCSEASGKIRIPISSESSALVSNAEINELPESLRPQLTGHLMKRDIASDSYPSLLFFYDKYLAENNSQKRQFFYGQFRQGLDLLDLDAITYEIIGTNRNSMGYWLPRLAEAVKQQKFFKIPDTTIIKVPLTLLQLTRQDYDSLTSTTLRIVDDFCQKAFNLDENKKYFIKTGTYSSKYDFRNAYVHGAKEVRELGEYLLYIHFQALQMSSPLSSPCIYGASTTNEWVVREFIEDKENNPTIYKGLPLHTEYRVFVDFDTNEVIGMNPYWDPTVMKQRFGHETDADNPHQIHDYIIYQMHEEVLMRRYKENKESVKQHIKTMLPYIDLSGQWSIDVMQNSDDFYIIDMALAANSALNHCIPKGILKQPEENWIPKLPLSIE